MRLPFFTINKTSSPLYVRPLPQTGDVPSVINLRYHFSIMKFLPQRRIFGQEFAETPTPSQPSPTQTNDEPEDSTLIKTLGWVTAGLGAVALGLVVGRELRQRYKFNRQTPYDLYAHSGDNQDIDFGLGI